MRQNDTQKTTSVFTVVIWLIIFWPVGLYYLFKKSAQDKGKEVMPGLGWKISGGIFLVIGLLGFLASYSTESGSGLATFFIILSFVFFSTGYQKKQKYIKARANNAQNYNTNTNQNINPNSFSRSYSTQQVNTTAFNPNKTVNTGTTQEKVSSNEPEEKVVTCKSCGANNKINRGQVKECEFCGTLLQ